MGGGHPGRAHSLKPNEKLAVFEAGLALIMLVGKGKHAELAENFVRSIARVEAFVTVEARPFIAKLFRPTPSELARNALAAGRIERWV